MATPYKLVAYINGIKFDPMSVSYSANDGGHASFSVQVPAVPEWDILPERSHCAVFYADPVSNSYRLLTEGEYLGYTKGREATGPRFRSLQFRSTNAVWESVKYASFVGLQPGKDVTEEAQVAAGSGYTVQAASGDGTQSATAFDLARTEIIKFIDDFSNNDTFFAAFIPNFVFGVMQQTPVDAFYYGARKLRNKVFSLQDNEIANVVQGNTFIAMVRDSWAPQNLSAGTSLESIIQAFENICMYKHVSIPSPPLLRLSGSDTGSDNVIAETLFLPHLYSVVPPACNVVFKDQISSIQVGRNFLSEPTRVVTQLTAPVEFGGGLPLFYMSNDVERSANVAVQLSGNANSNPLNKTNFGTKNAGTLVTHDFLTQEEYHRGVVPKFVNFPLQNLQKVSDVSTDDAKNKAVNRFDLYIQSACRHFYEVERGAARSATVLCTFLPYIVPGFPCLIEDDTGSFFGMVAEVNHTMPASGMPQTSLRLTHIREAYVVNGKLRNAMTPVWLNAKFLPENINETYAKLFGVNAAQNGFVTADNGAVKHAAMVPTIRSEKFGTDNKLNAAQQVNMDELATGVIPTPVYSTDGQFLTLSANTVADRIRASADPALAALQFQFRSGTSLSQFIQFHNLQTRRRDSTEDVLDYVFSSSPLPDDLSPDTVDPLFATPRRLIFEGRQAAEDPNNGYGVYRVDTSFGAALTEIRQRSARTIAAAIARRVTIG